MPGLDDLNGRVGPTLCVFVLGHHSAAGKPITEDVRRRSRHGDGCLAAADDEDALVSSQVVALGGHEKLVPGAPDVPVYRSHRINGGQGRLLQPVSGSS
jgi:hypothetical protein